MLHSSYFLNVQMLRCTEVEYVSTRISIVRFDDELTFVVVPDVNDGAHAVVTKYTEPTIFVLVRKLQPVGIAIEFFSFLVPFSVGGDGSVTGDEKQSLG